MDIIVQATSTIHFIPKTQNETCQESTLHAVELFTKLGFVVHPTKSSLIPNQELEFLGVLLNSQLMTVSLTPKKIAKVITLCQKYLGNCEYPIREIASLIGTLVGTFQGVDFGPLYYRSLVNDKEVALKAASGGYDHKMCLSL